MLNKFFTTTKLKNVILNNVLFSLVILNKFNGMGRNLIICLIAVSFFQCTSSNKKSSDNGIMIEFGEVRKVNTSLLEDIDFIKLETNEQCLIENINQIEVFNGHIYILDNYSLYVFGFDGKYIKKLQRSGNGSGEFMVPNNFWIDKNGYIYYIGFYIESVVKIQY